MVRMRENLVDGLFHTKVLRIEPWPYANSLLPFLLQPTQRYPVLIVTPLRPHKHFHLFKTMVKLLFAWQRQRCKPHL